MEQTPAELPSAAVHRDEAEDKAPDPRLHYDSPEDLAEDIELDLAIRENLLREWKYDLDQRLEAESEGMGTSGPLATADHARLSAEARRVSQAHDQVSTDLKLANPAGSGE